MGRYEKDDSGQWWYYRPNGARVRCKEKTCEFCGQPYVCEPYHAKTRKYCGRRCSGHAATPFGKPGDGAPRWAGGRRINAQGYVEVWVPIEERRKVRSYVLEHRLVMEQVLGRPLEDHEAVHHKNGIKDDNRPENLELWNRAHPWGQRAAEQAKPCPTCKGLGYVH